MLTIYFSNHGDAFADDSRFSLGSGHSSKTARNKDDTFQVIFLEVFPSGVEHGDRGPMDYSLRSDVFGWREVN